MGEKEKKKPLPPSHLFRNKKHNNESTGVHCAGALSVGFGRAGRSGLIPPQPSLFRVTCREESCVTWGPGGDGATAREWEKGKPEGYKWSNWEKTAPEGEELRPLLSPNTRFGPTALPRGQVTAGPGAPRAAWDARSARPSLARAAPAAPPPRPVRPVASRPLGCCRPGAHASRRQRGHFLTPGHCPGCRSRPVTGPAPTPAPGCRMWLTQWRERHWK